MRPGIFLLPLKANLKTLTKGSLSITDFLYSVKIKADELAVPGVPLDHEDITEKILEELGDDYRDCACSSSTR